ncbi:hypothetical protein [uncultured Aquimarina sp.]|uniref:hypothetical protein n=1 Tax=uncultured Aquimarina sp. TaxID=575652 RepID=UPI0026349721|nr:hypothetical protein [uncultured Aquimarina sp.]
MKKNTPLFVLLLYSMLSFSQSFNYQAVVRSSTGDIVTDQSVGMQIKLLQGSATGTTVYTETHTATTSSQGVVSLAVGTGTTTDTFANIDWSSQDYWLEVAMDITGGTTYTVIGTSQLLSVPYANYAANSPDADPANEIELPTGGTNGQVLATDGSGNYTWANQTLADNLGNHTATTNLQLGSNWLSNDGGSEGVSIGTDGALTIEAASARPVLVNGVGTGLASYIEINNEAGTRALFGPDGDGLSGGDTGDVAVANWSNGDLTFFTNASEHMRIDNTGNVGIGKTIPNAKLNVNGAIRVDTGGIRVDAGGVRIDGGGNGLLTYGANGTLNVAIREEYANAGGISLYNDSGQERIASFIDTSTDVGALFVYGPTSSNILLGNLNGENNNGFIGVADSNSSPNAGMYIDANGQGVVYGNIKNFKMDHPKDASKEIWYASLEGPEAGAYMRGTAKLINGKAVIQLPEHYQETINGTTLTMYLTPHSADSKGLSVVSKSQESFTVKELTKGKGNYTFDWVAFGVRKGFEDFEIVREKSQTKLYKMAKKQGSAMAPPAKVSASKKKMQVSKSISNSIQDTKTKNTTEIETLKQEVASLKKLVESLLNGKN